MTDLEDQRYVFLLQQESADSESTLEALSVDGRLVFRKNILSEQWPLQVGVVAFPIVGAPTRAMVAESVYLT